MARLPTHDLYALLGVPTDADAATIQRAWKAKIRQLHPDSQPEHQQAQAHEQAVKLNQARDILTDTLRRADYDLDRRARQRAAGTRSTSPPRREPPPSPPPPPPLRRIVVEPLVVDFGAVVVGQRAPDRRVTVRTNNGSALSQVAVLSHWGRFWTNDQYEDGRDVTEFVACFRGRQITANLEPGQHIDWVQIEVEGERVRVELTITVAAAPPPRPAEPQPAAEPAGAFARTGWTYSARTRWVTVVAMMAVFLAVILGVSGVHLGGGTTPAEPAPRPTAAAPTQASGTATATPNTTAAGAPYCQVTSVMDGSTAYYATVPGTTTPTSDQPVWTMAPPSNDPYWTWKSAAFPFWERINKRDGFSQGGQLYRAGTYVELHVILEEPWERLSPELLQKYPGLDAGAEAAARAQFIQEWSRELGVPRCE
ncbi:J domain-containing protein [Kitasatospora sp. NPDC050463]|uniref:J domain-containing protein n=1 Tax=Kitasatospora sp. NPDC050463 TaxID=3155786 RepID=UPI0033D9D88F